MSPDVLMEESREIATNWLTSAIRMSSHPQQAQIQVQMVQFAAVHVLATTILNAPANTLVSNAADMSEDACMERIFTLIRAEYAYMKTELVEGRLERVEHTVTASLPDTGLH